MHFYNGQNEILMVKVSKKEVKKGPKPLKT